jgi:sugar phosphate isomerase/epimerase
VTVLKLAAFADEISPQLDEQIAVCRANGVTHFELRGVYGKNVLDFDTPLREEIKTKLADQGMGVISIGSPIGKAKIDEAWEPHFERFKIAVEAAEFFNAPFVRLFSYYAPTGTPAKEIRNHRDEVLRRFRDKVDYLKNHPGVSLVHENEKDIYGELGQGCLDLMQSINSPKLRMAFDFANFVQAGQDPLACWPALKPFTAHIHIKDAIAGSGKVVPAGEGDGKIEPILTDAYASGYRGFVSLEPHLKVAGHSHGETGPELFKTAADALKQLCRRIGVPLAGA